MNQTLNCLKMKSRSKKKKGKGKEKKRKKERNGTPLLIPIQIIVEK